MALASSAESRWSFVMYHKKMCVSRRSFIYLRTHRGDRPEVAHQNRPEPQNPRPRARWDAVPLRRSAAESRRLLDYRGKARRSRLRARDEGIRVDVSRFRRA